jgi:hypothetical protein
MGYRNTVSATEADIGCQTHYQFSNDCTAHVLLKRAGLLSSFAFMPDLRGAK